MWDHYSMIMRAVEPAVRRMPKPTRGNESDNTRSVVEHIRSARRFVTMRLSPVAIVTSSAILRSSHRVSS